MPRYKLTIAYDGTDFSGWQKQEPPAPHSAPPQEKPEDQRRPDRGVAKPLPRVPESKIVANLGIRPGEDRPRVALRTVQHVLEQAVREVVREPVVLMGASRTDAGVHAKGQVAAFTCSGDEPSADHSLAASWGIPDDPPPDPPPAPPPDTPGNPAGRRAGWPIARGTDRLLRAINGRLPDDVLVTAAQPVHPDFNPIGDCTSKAYSYALHESMTRPLWDRRYVHCVWQRLDERAMHDAAQRLLGEHDFAAFAAANHGRLTTVRTIYACSAARTGDDRVRIDISGSGFLYNMVRIIAGTLFEVGRGTRTPDDIAAILASLDRRRAGPTLPARGLCLEWVKY